MSTPTFLMDTFSDTPGTLVLNHTGDDGGTWSNLALSGSSSLHLLIDDRGRVYNNVESLGDGVEWSVLPTSAEYRVTMVVDFLTHTDPSAQVVLWCRFVGAGDCYQIIYDYVTQTWYFYRKVATVVTTLASWGDVISDGESRTIRVECKDALKQVYIDDALQASTTDNAHTASGSIAFALANPNTVPTTTTGYHIASITARYYTEPPNCGRVLFGDFLFPVTFHPADEDLTWNPAITNLAREHGGRALDFYLGPKRLTVRGGEIKGPFDSSALRPRIDNIKAGLRDAPQDLYFYDDRFWREVRVESFRNPYGPTHFCRIAAEMEIQFVARDPYQYSIDLTMDTWSAPLSGDSHVLMTAGGARAKPTFGFRVGGSGSQTINWTLTNNTTGESFQLAGTVTGGQMLTVDCLDRTVKINSTDEIGLFDGEFLSLAIGFNSLSITLTTGSISSILTYWRDRWF